MSLHSLMRPLPIVLLLAVALLASLALSVALGSCEGAPPSPSPRSPPAPSPSSPSPVSPSSPAAALLPVPSPEADMGEGPAGDAIRRGRELAERTKENAPEHVGNELRCTSCHLSGAATPKAASWVGVTKRMPQYRARSGKVDTIEERINDCFERSLNGSALDEDSRQMKDIIAYMAYLSRDAPADGMVADTSIPLVELPRDPDFAHGKQVFIARCSACHGADGQGLRGANGKAMFPPVAGDGSFNIAAGMARRRTAAGFILHNMPLGQVGTLTAEEAWDVAGFLETLPRADFAEKHLDWPKGGKPVDARY